MFGCIYSLGRLFLQMDTCFFWMASVVWPIQRAEAGQLDLEEMEHDMSAPLIVLGSGP